ncbi:hypothetical protein ACROYT_G002286 [Oculina patagonica]
MKKRGVKFHEGIPEEVDLTKWFPRGGVMVLDDLMEEGGNDKRVLDLFTKLSHHRNITVLYLCQDMFPPGKYAKSISRNAHYIVAFKNPRDQLGMRNLLLQAFPSRWQDVMDVYTKTTERPFGYMVLDLHPASGDDRRIFSHLLKGEGCMRCYRFVPEWCHASLNALALFIVAAGIIAGSLTENSVIVACLTSAGTVVKGWNDFKKYSFKVDVCRFAYTTYDKTLIELRTYARGLPMDELEGFLIKMQTLDDTITDFTPPVADKYVQAYERQHDKSEDVDRDDDRTMRRKKRVTQRRRRAGRRRIGQKGGILPLAALIPALIAGGKAIALGAASGAAGWGAKKALDAATRKKKR